MNLTQTLYLAPSKDPFRDAFGWAAPEYHLMGWALSCLQVHKIYEDISLFANSPAAHLLIDTLQLPYTKINLAHDRLTLIHQGLWALPKIYTYSLQEQPFLHIDGDVFLFNPLNPELLEGELIAQNVEVDNNYYTSTQKELMHHFTFFPPCVKKDFESGVPIQACNAGILGGTKVSFFKEYAATAFEYIQKNSEKLNHINVNGFNVFFEQHLFYALAKEKGIHVSVLFKEIIKANEYRCMGDFHNVPFNRSYLHLLGHFKRDKFTCTQMAVKLRELYPEYYERIVALFRNKKIRLSPYGFINEGDSKANSFNRKERKGFSEMAQGIDEQNNTHLQLLRSIADNCPSGIEKKQFQSDFENFYRQLVSLLKSTSSDSKNCHDGLDPPSLIVAQHWYRTLFADSSTILNQTIVRCKEAKIIESSFNWAGLFNKYYKEQIRYYSNLQVSKGQFFNLIVQEATDNGFSLYDMDELDHTILSFLSEPLSIHELLIKMQDHFEKDVWQNHYEVYENFILMSIKQLVIKKAIQPIIK